MKLVSFDQQIKAYEDYQHQRRQEFLERMEQKLEHKNLFFR